MNSWVEHVIGHVTRVTQYIFSRVRSRGFKHPDKVLANSGIEHVIGHVILNIHIRCW